ncbi:hypothetical protein JOD54_000772 [Actinokineospora baliensis]|uniref:DUF397 domain-containing protein n=1 Tax=Actinokineospora baliensis TaxID=547056 RepID=UPI00195E70B1|nr:DUF397 domain-containing protein [Actinokineospora baliensis]MBM7770568.1 hypothetical protein [Actinokineospora baliensis]
MHNLIWRKSSASSANGECVEVAHIWRKSSYSGGNGECVEVAHAWRKSSASSANGQCVEVAVAAGRVAVRDSKNPHGPVVLLPVEGLAALVASFS